MRRLVVGAGLAILFFPSCASLSTRGLTEYRLQHDGRERTYLIHRPARSESKTHPRALVMVLHGGGATGEKMVRLTNGRFNELADRDDVVVVYPEGIGHTWNDGRDPTVSKAQRDHIDDVGFLRAIIRETAARDQVDPSRVFVTGISNGGLMAFRHACELPAEIRAIAALAASISTRLEPACKHATTVSLLLMNGTADPLVPYEGGEIRAALFGRERTRGEVMATKATVALWAGFAGCPSAPKRVMLPDSVDDGTYVIRQTFGPCTSGARVELYRIEGGGHTWPGGRQYLPEGMIGPTSRDIVACDVIWDFFRSIDQK